MGNRWVAFFYQLLLLFMCFNYIELRAHGVDILPFRADQDLENDPNTMARKCLQEFLQKGGRLQSIPDLSAVESPCIRLHANDAVYPVCSGGWCRSQALWAILKPYSSRIILFPPHAARLGWDPYAGEIRRYLNEAQEELHDEFSAYFGIEKALRFGFEHAHLWKQIEALPTQEGLATLSHFYDHAYFGPSSAWQGQQGSRRVYIAFSHNAHVVMHRLLQTNDSLAQVTVIAIDSEDIITNPPAFLNTPSRSRKAYEYFSTRLAQLVDVNLLSEITL